MNCKHILFNRCIVYFGLILLIPVGCLPPKQVQKKEAPGIYNLTGWSGAYITYTNGMEYGTASGIDIEGKKGEIQLPQFHALVDLLENKCSFYTTPNAHPDIKQFAEDYVRVYWRVLNHVLKEDEVIKETMDNILLASYPERYN